MFRDRAHPFESYDDAELFMRYRFRRADTMNLIDMVGDNVSVAERKGSLTPTLQVIAEQQCYNDSHCATRCIIERCNSPADM